MHKSGGGLSNHNFVQTDFLFLKEAVDEEFEKYFLCFGGIPLFFTSKFCS